MFHLLSIVTIIDQPSIAYASRFNLRNITDTSGEVITGLKSIDAKTSNRAICLMYMLQQIVDPKTRKEWTQNSSKKETIKHYAHRF